MPCAIPFYDQRSNIVESRLIYCDTFRRFFVLAPDSTKKPCEDHSRESRPYMAKSGKYSTPAITAFDMKSAKVHLLELRASRLMRLGYFKLYQCGRTSYDDNRYSVSAYTQYFKLLSG